MERVTGIEEEPFARPAITRVGWLVTFTDLVSLMLTFFVMLFAMSNVKIDDWQSMVDTLSRTLNPVETRKIDVPTVPFNIATLFRRQAINLDYLAAVLEDTVKGDPVLAGSRIVRLDDRMIIALPGDVLFEPAAARLNARARDALFTLGGVLSNVGNQIGVHGHTDPAPPPGRDYASNWELSMARAAAVANALRLAGYADDIIAYGFGDSRFGQLPAAPEAERRAMARRVDIVVMPTAWGG